MVTAGGTSTGVSVRMPADDLAAPVAAKVAAGAVEALHLGFGPGRRLTAIALEATRNAVEHAYNGKRGAVELSIGVSPPGESLSDSDDAPTEVRVQVRDFGTGCPMEPTSADPPGLGLSIMSELSEELQITSRRDGGTEIDALIRAGNGVLGDPVPVATNGDTAPDHVSALRFSDPAFMSAVVPRTIAAHAAAMDASIDAIEGAIRAGSAIARSLADYPELPEVRIGCEQDALQVTIGPVGTDAGQAIRRYLEPEFGFENGPALETRESIDQTGFIFVTIGIPLH